MSQPPRCEDDNGSNVISPPLKSSESYHPGCTRSPASTGLDFVFVRLESSKHSIPGTKPTCVIETLAVPFADDTTHTIPVLFHSVLSCIQCRLQLVTCHTIFLSGMTSTIVESTNVSPTRTVKLSPICDESPVTSFVHQSETRLILSNAFFGATWAVDARTVVLLRHLISLCGRNRVVVAKPLDLFFSIGVHR